MKLQRSLAYLLLALCLHSGAASPLQSGGEGAGAGGAQGVEDAISHGVGEAVGQGAKEAASSGIQDALGQGGSALRARGDTFGEAARSLGNAGNEVGRQVEDVVRRGIDAVHNSRSWGTSGGHGVFVSQGGVGGQGSPGGQGTPWAEGNFGSNSLGGSVGQGGNSRSYNDETGAQGAVAQPGYGSVRGGNQNSGCTNPPPSDSEENISSSGGSSSSGGHGGSSGGHNSGGSHGSSSNSGGAGSRSQETPNFDDDYSVSRGSGSSSGSRGGSGGGNKPECENSGNDVRMSGGSRSQESTESSHLGGSHDYQDYGFSGNSVENKAVSELSAMNSDAASLPFNFDKFWENFKSKLGFINWDAISKGRSLPSTTRVLLYFRRLWENFKRRTPYFNWKEIENPDVASLQKRAGGADQFAQPEAAKQVSAVTAKNSYNNPQVNPTYNWQYYTKNKGGVTPTPPSSSASRAQPGLLKWLKFW